jgi:SAM-dependent methyltransferase
MKCNLCGNKNNFTTISTKIREGDGLILECPICKHVFQAIEMNADELEEYYNEIYIATNSLSDTQIDVEEHFQERLKTLDDMLKHIIPILEKHMKVLDIGAGAGALLSSIKDKVSSVYATELNKSYVEYMKNKGINAQYGFFEKLKFDTKMDLIISINAIDHMPNPMEILEKIYDCLNDGGKIYFELPNRDDALNLYLPKDNREKFNTFFWHKAHFSYFSAETIQYALEKVGFNDIEIDFRHEYTIVNFLNWYFTGNSQKTFVNATTNTDLFEGNSAFEVEMNNLFKNVNEDFLHIMKKTGRGDTIIITARK